MEQNILYLMAFGYYEVNVEQSMCEAAITMNFVRQVVLL